MIKENLKLSIFLVILFIGISIPFLGSSYTDPPITIYCFDQADCDNPICPTNLKCYDDRPGCFVTCKASGEYCPIFSACGEYMGVETQTCGYSPLTPSCNISASPSTIGAGESSTLTWSSDANPNCSPWGECCTASGGWSGTKSTSGSEPVWPTETTIYTLTCTNNCEDGSVSKDCSVTVIIGSQICAPNSNWCEGNYAWHCSSDGLSKWSEDCDSYDGCVGTTYRDWYCSGGNCTYTDYPNDSRCVAPNNLPQGSHDGSAIGWGGCDEWNENGCGGGTVSTTITVTV